VGPRRAAAFAALPGADVRNRTLPIDPWVLEPLEAWLRAHDVEVAGPARPKLAELRAEHDIAVEAIRRSRAKQGDPIPEVERVLGGELAPFQWAGVRYLLDARRTFLADEQGLGKTVQALAALEADDAYPAVVVCPASLKLNWERETAKWLPHRSLAGPQRPRHRGAEGRPRDRQLRDRRVAPRLAPAHAPAGARVRRVALLQEPPGQAHPGRPAPGLRAARAVRCASRSPARRS
jgi:hypothetical protein